MLMTQNSYRCTLSVVAHIISDVDNMPPRVAISVMRAMRDFIAASHPDLEIHNENIGTRHIVDSEI